jgi:hypothetical protein
MLTQRDAVKKMLTAQATRKRGVYAKNAVNLDKTRLNSLAGFGTVIAFKHSPKAIHGEAHSSHRKNESHRAEDNCHARQKGTWV